MPWEGKQRLYSTKSRRQRWGDKEVGPCRDSPALWSFLFVFPVEFRALSQADWGGVAIAPFSRISWAGPSQRSGQQEGFWTITIMIYTWHHKNGLGFLFVCLFLFSSGVLYLNYGIEANSSLKCTHALPALSLYFLNHWVFASKLFLCSSGSFSKRWFMSSWVHSGWAGMSLCVMCP